MSERSEHAVARLADFRRHVDAMPPGPNREQLVDQTEALIRAVSSFHMEAIRFRMFSVDRLLRQEGAAPQDVQDAFEIVRKAIEEAGFHTRSHTAP